MLSPTSLQAFSSTVAPARPAPAGRAAETGAVHAARAQGEAQARQTVPAQGAVSEPRPGVPPPRGSLLNLSV